MDPPPAAVSLLVEIELRGTYERISRGTDVRVLLHHVTYDVIKTSKPPRKCNLPLY